ncbi:MAG: hypothetical protein ACSLE6_17265 [Mycobacterium sp.]
MTIVETPPAVPSTAPPPLGPGGGRTTIRVLLLVAAALLAVASVGILTAAAIGLGNTRVVTDSQALPATMRNLIIDTGRVPVGVRITSDEDASQPRVDVRFVGTDTAGEHTLAVTTEGSDTRIALLGAEPDDFGWSRAGAITLVLPPELARRLSVTTTQQFGVLMADADLDRLVAHTANGAIVLRGAARSIEVETQHGSIYSRDAIDVRESFFATTVDGGISVDFAQGVPETVEASTGTGDIEIGLPMPGPYRVTVQSGFRSGSEISVDQTNDPASAVATITAESTRGSVTVSYEDDR